MSEKPVAWMNSNAPEGIFARHEEGAKNFGCTVPLYAHPPSVARAMAIAECARVCEEWGNAKVAKWSGTELETDAKSRAWDGLQCAAAIRALSSPPSVSEEWVEKIAIEYSPTFSGIAMDAIKAYHAALGVTEEGAAK